MAFIDKIGEKISQGAATVSSSTKRMTDTARIKSAINQNNNEINKRMAQIGMRVKAHCLSQIDDKEILELAAEIDTIIESNEKLSEELKRYNGIVKCAACGKEMSDSAVYCPSCGAKNVPNNTSDTHTEQSRSAENAEQVFCTNCGTPNTSGAAFCPNCGERLEK